MINIILAGNSGTGKTHKSITQGVKCTCLCSTIPVFLSPNVVQILVENLDIIHIGDVKADVDAIMQDR